MVDVDNFKAVNDSLGHDWGDSILRVVVGRSLQQFARPILIRQTDFAARYGGRRIRCSPT
jgi:diguanylate cyclase (GGDEF)-like protein